MRFLQSGYILRLGTLHTLSDFESHFLTFLERYASAAGIVYLTEVYEYIVPTIILLNKTITLFVVEPFDGSMEQFCHFSTFF